MESTWRCKRTGDIINWESWSVKKFSNIGANLACEGLLELRAYISLNITIGRYGPPRDRHRDR